MAMAGVEGSIFCPKKLEIYKLRNSINNNSDKALV
jgi:hypothetical protein